MSDYQPTRQKTLTFMLAWVILVLCVAGGFFVQARTIDKLEDQQKQITAIQEQEADQRDVLTTIFCQLFLKMAPGKHNPQVTQAFADINVECKETG